MTELLFFLISFIVSIIDAQQSGCNSPKFQLGEEGIFSSMRYPFFYNKNAWCEWIIEVPARKNIKLTFDKEFFALEQSNSQCQDYVYVFRGSNSDGEKLAKICGQIVPAPIFIQGNQAFIIFKSNNHTQNYGFKLKWSVVETIEMNQSGCNSPTYLYGAEGSFSSMNYPDVYPHLANCSWLLRFPNKNKFQLYFDLVFDIEYYGTTCYDYIEIFEGFNSQSEKIGKYCGRSPPEPIPIKDGQAFITFISDTSDQRKGFRIQWKEVKNFDTDNESGCNSLKYQFGNKGVFNSINYPNLYENLANCTWLISVPKSKKIKLTFNTNFELEKGPESEKCYDSVNVYFGWEKLKNERLGTYCGEKAPYPIIVENHEAVITFVSDSAIPFKGFQIVWMAI